MRRSGVVFAGCGPLRRLVSRAAISSILPALLLLSVPARSADAGQVSRNQNSSSQDLATSENEVLIGTVDVNPPAAAVTLPAAKPNSTDTYAQGLRALEAGDFAAAEELFEKTVAADPKSADAADARRHLGQLYSNGPATAGTGSATGALPQTPEQGSPRAQTGRSQSAAQASGADSALSSARDAQDSSQGHGPQTGSDADRFLVEAGDRVFFSSGSAELGGRARTVLAAQALWLAKRHEWNVSVEGHADDRPLSETEMEELSEARAVEVRERLIAEGVAANRISIVPWGRQIPISDCQETGCQAQNRRVITVLTPRQPLGQKNSQLRPAAPAPLASERAASTAR